MIIPSRCEVLRPGRPLRPGQLDQKVHASLNRDLSIIRAPAGRARRVTLQQQVSARLESHFGDKVFKAIVPRNAPGQKPAAGIPGVVFDRSAKGAQAYLAFAREMIERVKTLLNPRLWHLPAQRPRPRLDALLAANNGSDQDEGELQSYPPRNRSRGRIPAADPHGPGGSLRTGGIDQDPGGDAAHPGAPPSARSSMPALQRSSPASAWRAAQLAGPGAIWAWLIGAAVIMTIALTYSRARRDVPRIRAAWCATAITRTAAPSSVSWPGRTGSRSSRTNSGRGQKPPVST